mmetsp:Transcript_8883/g.23310  ORF Transcript_8883/g.23310 Transcript_8883/m.23310 type:complete len:143 (+) Transcript_8883:240-668(+)
MSKEETRRVIDAGEAEPRKNDGIELGGTEKMQAARIWSKTRFGVSISAITGSESLNSVLNNAHKPSSTFGEAPEAAKQVEPVVELADSDYDLFITCERKPRGVVLTKGRFVMFQSLRLSRADPHMHMRGEYTESPFHSSATM